MASRSTQTSALPLKHGFYLFIDEAGDEGLERVRPLDPDGSSEYFVMCGLLIRASRKEELSTTLSKLKEAIGVPAESSLHFRDLNVFQQIRIVQEISKLEIGLIAIASNKRNMKNYRNRRVEAKNYEVVRGRTLPKKRNWLYNHIFRYLLERASEECERRTHKYYKKVLPIKIIFAHRSNFQYSQTQAYLHWIKTRSQPRSYFNNKKQVVWPVVDIAALTSERPKNEPGLQLVDCVASAVYKALDEDNFGSVIPEYLEALSPRFLRKGGSIRDHGFKLLPDDFEAPLTDGQKRGLAAVGYTFK